MLAQIGLVGASIALGTQGFSPLTNQAAMAALGVGTQVGVLLPFSRAHESEADYIGLLLAADAGYDPREAVHVWERMQQVYEHAPKAVVANLPSIGAPTASVDSYPLAHN